MFDQIDCLPDAFLLLFLSDWLTLMDVAKFDTGFCCGQRKWLLELLNDLKQNGDISAITSEKCLSHNYYRWISLRGVQLKVLKISLKSFSEGESDSKLSKKWLTHPVKTISVQCINISYLDPKRGNDQNVLFKSVAGMNVFHDDTQIVQIINSCSKLRVLNVVSSLCYFNDWTFGKINLA